MIQHGLRDWQIPHARHLAKVLALRRSAHDGSDTGTGKTYCSLAVARELTVEPLIVCPLSVIPSWETALGHFGLGGTIVNYETARGHSSQKTKGLSVGELGQEKAWGKGSFWEWRQKHPLIIFDEVDRCAGGTSLNSKMLIAARRQAQRVATLSATAAESPLQLKALGYALGLHNLSDFKFWLLKNGCKPGTFGGFVFSGNPETQAAAMAKLHAELYPTRGSRLRKADIPGFPKHCMQIMQIEDTGPEVVKLSERLRDAYMARRQQQSDAEARLEQEQERRSQEPEDDEEEAPTKGGSALEVRIRSRQALELLKVPMLTEIAVDRSRSARVAIFCNYRETIDELRVALAVALKVDFVPVLDGRNKGDERETWRSEFQEGKHPAILVNSAACGVGVSLHDPKGIAPVDSVILPMYSARLLKQVIGRGHRDGGAFATSLFVYFKLGEQKIADALFRKLDNLDALNDGELNGAD